MRTGASEPSVMSMRMSAVSNGIRCGEARSPSLTIVVVDLQHLGDPVVDLLVVLLLLQTESSLGLGDLLDLSSDGLDLLDPLGGGSRGPIEVVSTGTGYTGSEGSVDEGVVGLGSLRSCEQGSEIEVLMG